MTHLPLPTTGPRSGYGQRRSPAALAGAVALNGGVFALLLALPATHYIIEKTPPLPTHWVQLDKDPPPERTEPVKKDVPVPTRNTLEQEAETILPVIVPPVVPFDGTGTITGTTEPPVIPVVVPTQPPAVVRKPTFISATRDPRYADAFHPAYPAALVRAGLEGSVTVRVTIDEKGRVIACDLVKATNQAFFEETKEQALRRWHFRPATSDGVPVQSQQTLTVHYELEA